MVIPSMPIPTRASLTSSILCGWMIASIFFMVSALFLRCEVCDQREQQRRLGLAHFAVLLLEERLVGPIVAELAARKQPALDLVVRRESHFCQVLGRAGGVAGGVLEVAEARSERRLARRP